jgi:hypothetical protein
MLHTIWLFYIRVGSVVRPKLLATSSALIGIKRSEENLKKDRFQIESFCTWLEIIPSVELIAASICALANRKCLTSGIWLSAIEHVVVVVARFFHSLPNFSSRRIIHF